MLVHLKQSILLCTFDEPSWLTAEKCSTAVCFKVQSIFIDIRPECHAFLKRHQPGLLCAVTVGGGISSSPLDFYPSLISKGIFPLATPLPCHCLLPLFFPEFYELRDALRKIVHRFSIFNSRAFLPLLRIIIKVQSISSLPIKPYKETVDLWVW